ncbi:hypothetical protein AcidC75_20220 [Acidisoma sp. C75]
MRPKPGRPLAVLLVFVLGFGLYASRLGPDAGWDLRNYHLYNPFAVLHGKFGFDLVPAQEQTFLAPQLDLISYGVRHVLNGFPGLFNAVMSVPTAIAAFLAFLITCLFLPRAMPARLVLAILITLIGATGAAGWPTIATSSSESIPACFSLAGLLLILIASDAGRPSRRLGMAGLLLGIAAGFKLTSLPFCIGGAAAALLTPLPAPVKWRALGHFAIGGLLGSFLIAAPWWITLETRYHSPLFPFFNQIFHSPDYLPLAMSDDRFKPHGLIETVFYPAYWAWSATPRVTEMPMRDPRFALALVMLIATAVVPWLRRQKIEPKAAMLTAFFIVSYCLWEELFAIFRYLATIEMLTATTLVLAWRSLDTTGRRPLSLWAGTICLALLCGLTTLYPDWGRAPPGPRAVDVRAPRLPPNALVILLDDAPMAYVAAFEPPSVRFVGANNNIVAPGQKSLLNEQVAAAIGSATGPLWGLAFPPLKAMDDATLARYGLHRTSPCTVVTSNLDANSLTLCPLARDR